MNFNSTVYKDQGIELTIWKSRVIQRLFLFLNLERAIELIRKDF